MKKLLYTTTLILFGSVAFAQQPSNASFEDWDTLGTVNGKRLNMPISWQTTNGEALGLDLKQPANYTTDAHTGKYALELSSVTDENDGQMGMVMSGSGFTDLNNAGEKFALTGKPKKFGAWIKYYPEGQDSFTVMIMFYKQGEFLGSAFIQSSQVIDVYTKMEQNIVFNTGVPTPDSAKIAIIPGQDIPFSKTFLTIDDIYVEYEGTTGIGEQQAEKIGVFPNPAVNQLTLQLPAQAVLTQVTCTDLQGKAFTLDLEQENKLDLAALKTGIYMIHGIDKNGKLYQAKFVKE